ncbi:MAG: cytochrome c biogenesis protein CcdA, partial [Euryarchaeota archaeon]|nr:cytochrome c biogenesis protein CcdA [Euryarchaeota archaeon]
MSRTGRLLLALFLGLLLVLSLRGPPGLAQVTFLAAFLAGVLSTLSPCSLAMFPAFFAYSFKERGELVKMTLVFVVGMNVVFIPLAVGVFQLGRLVDPGALARAAGGFLVFFGVLSVFGKSILPQRGVEARRDTGGVFLVGLFYGAGFVPCVGPVLGAILTLASSQGSLVESAFLLVVYSAGIAAPLFLLAYHFDRRGLPGWVRGRGVRLGGLEVNSTSLLAGLLFVLLGLLFLLFGQTSGFFLDLFTRLGLLEPFFAVNDAVIRAPDRLLAAGAALGLLVLGALEWRERG